MTTTTTMATTTTAIFVIQSWVDSGCVQYLHSVGVSWPLYSVCCSFRVLKVSRNYIFQGLLGILLEWPVIFEGPDSYLASSFSSASHFSHLTMFCQLSYFSHFSHLSPSNLFSKINQPILQFNQPVLHLWSIPVFVKESLNSCQGNVGINLRHFWILQ